MNDRAARASKLRLGQVALDHGPLALGGEELLLSQKLDVLALAEFVEQGLQGRADVRLFYDVSQPPSCGVGPGPRQPSVCALKNSLVVGPSDRLEGAKPKRSDI